MKMEGRSTAKHEFSGYFRGVKLIYSISYILCVSSYYYQNSRGIMAFLTRPECPNAVTHPPKICSFSVVKVYGSNPDAYHGQVDSVRSSSCLDDFWLKILRGLVLFWKLSGVFSRSCTNKILLNSKIHINNLGGRSQKLLIFNFR